MTQEQFLKLYDSLPQEMQDSIYLIVSCFLRNQEAKAAA